MKKRIVFTKHSLIKMTLLAKHGFKATKPQVEETLVFSEKISDGYKSRKVAQRSISAEHLLRVIYEESAAELKVITLYPARRDRYEN